MRQTWKYIITGKGDKEKIVIIFLSLSGCESLYIYIYIYIYSKENSAYVGLTTTTLSRRLTIHLNDSSSIVFHLKNNSIPKYKSRKILVENTTIIAHEIDNLWLQIQEALHIKTKQEKIKLLESISKIATMFWNAFNFFSVFLCILFPLTAIFF